MFTRRAALMGAAVVATAPFVINAAHAQETAANGGSPPADLSALTRRKVKLLAPPFVPAHEQVASTGPQIIEFEMKIIEAVNLGASAPVVMEGDWNNDLLEQLIAPVDYDAARKGRTALP